MRPPLNVAQTRMRAYILELKQIAGMQGLGHARAHWVARSLANRIAVDLMSWPAPSLKRVGCMTLSSSGGVCVAAVFGTYHWRHHPISNVNQDYIKTTSGRQLYIKPFQQPNPARDNHIHSKIHYTHSCTIPSSPRSQQPCAVRLTLSENPKRSSQP